mmetsp:Transcript_40636/g.73017  ORF Transcript_40636/g.73017 Transcript_40636/m.73017 type:complete len:212 (-) Transcript_40636:306-941(-)
MPPRIRPQPSAANNATAVTALDTAVATATVDIAAESFSIASCALPDASTCLFTISASAFSALMPSSRSLPSELVEERERSSVSTCDLLFSCVAGWSARVRAETEVAGRRFMPLSLSAAGVYRAVARPGLGSRVSATQLFTRPPPTATPASASRSILWKLCRRVIAALDAVGCNSPDGGCSEVLRMILRGGSTGELPSMPSSPLPQSSGCAA